MGGGHPRHKEALEFLGFSSVIKWSEVQVGHDIQLGDGMSVACDGSGGNGNYEKGGMGQRFMNNNGNAAGKEKIGSG